MIRYHRDLIQGSEEWHAARCGMLTASEFDRILTPTLRIIGAAPDREEPADFAVPLAALSAVEYDLVRKDEAKRLGIRTATLDAEVKKALPAVPRDDAAHLWELAAQRISRYVEPQYVSDSMLRGHDDEITARDLYAEHFAPVEMCGFVTNDRWGFTLGCSPDGLVGDDGLIECKSRAQRFQVQTICEHYLARVVPADFMLQVQGELLITEREWCDLISFSGGLPMVPMRVHADQAVQGAILEAVTKAEERIGEIVANYHAALGKLPRLIPTERKIYQEMFV